MFYDKRIKWIDYAKAIAIVCVIYGHTYENIIVKWIYSFHMPLWFFLSGITFKYYEDMNTFIKKKCKSIIVPYIQFGIIRIIWISIKKIVLYRDYDMTYIFKLLVGIVVNKRNEEYSIGLWFLPLLFFTELFAYLIINKFRKKKYFMFYVECVIILLLVFEYLYWKNIKYIFPYGIDAIGSSLSFFLIGYLYKKNKKNRNINCKKKILFAFIVNVISGAINTYIISKSKIDMYYGNYGNILLYFISAISGIYFILKLCILIDNVVIKKILFIGKNTLYIYCLHQIFIDIGDLFLMKVRIDPYANYFNTYTIDFLITIWAMLMSLLCIMVFSKIKNNSITQNRYRKLFK